MKGNWIETGSEIDWDEYGVDLLQQHISLVFIFDTSFTMTYSIYRCHKQITNES